MPLDYSIILQLKVILETTLFGSRGWLRIGLEQKDSDEDRNSTVGDNGLFEETVGDLKQSKARYKTAFTMTRRRLLVSIQQPDVTIEQIDEASEYLNVAMDEAMEAMAGYPSNIDWKRVVKVVRN